MSDFTPSTSQDESESSAHAPASAPILSKEELAAAIAKQAAEYEKGLLEELAAKKADFIEKMMFQHEVDTLTPQIEADRKVMLDSAISAVISVATQWLEGKTDSGLVMSHFTQAFYDDFVSMVAINNGYVKASRMPAGPQSNPSTASRGMSIKDEFPGITVKVLDLAVANGFNLAGLDCGDRTGAKRESFIYNRALAYCRMLKSNNTLSII